MDGRDSPPRPDFPGLLTARLLGLLLIAAACLKIAETVIHGVQAPWISAMICFELFLGLWLLSGIRRNWSMMVTVVTFFCFAAVTLRMVVQGVSDCGCFGVLALSPKVTYWIDLAALSAAIGALGLIRLRTLLVVVMIPAMALYLGAMTLAVHRSSDAKIEIGNPWPPKGTVDCPADLSKGRWVALIYDSTCGHCRSLAAEYAGDAATWSAQGRRTRLALLDVGNPEEEGAPTPSSQIVRGNLIKGDFYDHAPILLLLDQGKVWGIEVGWGAVDWSDPTHASWIP